jgi:hypothetical protein
MFKFLKRLLFGNKSSSKIITNQPPTEVIKLNQLKSINISSDHNFAQISSLIPSINQINSDNLQTTINQISNYETLTLNPPLAEYKAPIIINHPISIEGQGATLWSKQGAVVIIRSNDVCLQNLRLEITEKQDQINSIKNCVILVESGQNLQFNNVEIRGNIMGIPEEEGQWFYPETLNLGQLTAKQEHQLILRLIVPISCEINTDIAGLNLTSNQLKSGNNEINLNLEALPELLLQGNLWLVSPNFKRRISLTAQIMTNAPTNQRIIWQPPQWSTSVKNTAKISSLPQLTNQNIAISKPLNSSSIPKIEHNQTPNQESLVIKKSQDLPVISSQKSLTSSVFQPPENKQIINKKTNSIPLISEGIFSQSNSENKNSNKSNDQVNKISLPDIFK